MAYVKLSLDTYFAEKLRIERLRRFGNKFEIATGISLDALEAANEEVRISVNEKNAALLIADAKGTNCLEKSGNYDKMLTAVRNGIGITHGTNSDEWVTAGGVRQSEVIDKQKKTREANKKAEEEKAKLTDDKEKPKE